MTSLVTGGTGFVGANLVRALLADGDAVRVLARPQGDRRAIVGLPVEIVEGTITDEEVLQRAVAGCQVVYHVAADYRLWVRDPRPMYWTNVEGTKRLIRAAEAAGVPRIVYTSTVGTLGIPPDGRPGTEETPVRLEDMVGHYKRSKFLAEREAEAAAQRGAPVVIVNPSTPIGPWDVKPTPTGRMILDYLRGRMFAYLDTGLNLIHVQDVARGHILAARQGRIGAKYILGNQNLTLAEIFTLLERQSGIPAPRWRIPYPLAWWAALAMEAGARAFTMREPRASLTAVRMAKKRMFFDAARARRELGLPQQPIERALIEAITWFRAAGYLQERKP